MQQNVRDLSPGLLQLHILSLLDVLSHRLTCPSTICNQSQQLVCPLQSLMFSCVGQLSTLDGCRLDAEARNMVGCYFNAHRPQDGQWLPADSMPKTKTGQPIAFVAKGAHGLYKGVNPCLSFGDLGDVCNTQGHILTCVSVVSTSCMKSRGVNSLICGMTSTGVSVLICCMNILVVSGVKFLTVCWCETQCMISIPWHAWLGM